MLIKPCSPRYYISTPGFANCAHPDMSEEHTIQEGIMS